MKIVVDAQWDDEAKTIIRQIYEGDIILDDYYLATDEFIKLAKSVPHTVHSIMDRSKIRKTSGSVLRVMRYASERMPANVSLRIIVRANMMTKITVDMGKKIAPKLVENVAYCENLEEAHRLIANHSVKISSEGAKLHP